MKYDVIHAINVSGSEHIELKYKCSKVSINNFSETDIKVKFEEDGEYIQIPSEMGEEFTFNEKGAAVITELWIEGSGKVEVQETAWSFNN